MSPDAPADFLLTSNLLGASTLIIQADHVLARHRLNLPVDPLLRASACLAALLTIVAGSVTGTALASLTLSAILLTLYVRAPDGLDTADGELWVFVTLVSIALLAPSFITLSWVCIVASYTLVYFFAGLNKLRSVSWRSGTAFATILAGHPSSPAGRLVRNAPRSALSILAWIVIAFQLAVAITWLSPSLLAPWFIVALLFQATIAVLLSLPSFMLIAVSLSPLFLAGMSL